MSEFHKDAARKAARAMLSVAVHVAFAYPEEAPDRATCREAVEKLLFPLNRAGDQAGLGVDIARLMPVLRSLVLWARASEVESTGARARLQFDLRRYYAAQAAERIQPLLNAKKASA